MSRPNNYAIMADQARTLFLTYDQSALIAKSPVTFDGDWLYLPVLDRICRIDRHTGHIYWSTDQGWSLSTGFQDTLTVFDYLCDGRPDRSLSGEERFMASFGHQFHTGLLENETASPLELAIDQNPRAFSEACTALGGVPVPNCDLGFRLPFFPDLPVTLRFWHSDEEFPPALRCYWDANAGQYLRYETMYYALDLLRSRLWTLMGSCKFL